MYRLFFLLLFLKIHYVNAQIVINNNAPYDSPTWLVDNVLLGGGIVASNHSFEGDSVQIGWFNASQTNLGIDSGIVLATGDIYELDPNAIPTFPFLPNLVTDPDLLGVANSVPPLIGQTFTVSSINDVAKLEFDFVPTSDTITFRYVFGSQEYFAWENTSYNDVFGFFLSGPGISGPYSAPAIHPNGSINLAIVPGSNPPLPITISSVNSVTPINQQYFIDNTLGLDTIASADGFTTVLTAVAVVECGETYHIRLAIADGSDQALSSYVWLEAGSFTSPELDVSDDFGIDSTYMTIPCNSSITLTASGGSGASYLWNNGSTDSSITVGPGDYWVSATSVGCSIDSDTLTVIADLPPVFDLGLDYTIQCNTTTLIDPIVTGGSGVYNYLWYNENDSLISIDSTIDVAQGEYLLVIDDGTGCLSSDSIIITELAPPLATISGGGMLCDDGFSNSNINFSFSGILPWDLTYLHDNDTIIESNISITDFNLITSNPGTYSILTATDPNLCNAISSGLADITTYPLPNPEVNPKEATIYIGESVVLQTDDYAFYQWFNQDDSLISEANFATIIEAGQYYVWVEDTNGCENISDYSIVNSVPKTTIFIPNSFTPNEDEHNELFVVMGENIVSYNLMIFNRWGHSLFETDILDNHWDGTYLGKKVPEGTYFYHLELVGADGVPVSKTGSVNILY
tara:strand:+ start:2072 stop:4132 length:2061 start_codon:yes stop_codon:yes gene_type:complete